MTRLARNILILLATALVSGPAFAAIDFRDDFESYPIFEGVYSDIGGGWGSQKASIYGEFELTRIFSHDANRLKTKVMK